MKYKFNKNEEYSTKQFMEDCELYIRIKQIDIAERTEEEEITLDAINARWEYESLKENLRQVNKAIAQRQGLISARVEQRRKEGETLENLVNFYSEKIAEYENDDKDLVDCEMGE